MATFAEACRRPFSNGTEGDAWIAKWCAYCTRDHNIHEDHGLPGCSLMDVAMFTDEWPEGWLPEPDDGHFALPSRLICTAFTPCHEGKCTGDPGAESRSERVVEVTAYWAGRR